jgi:hypothetical protein
MVRMQMSFRVGIGPKWTGQDDFGRRVSSGVYYLKLEAGEQSGVRKLVLSR